MNMIVFFIIFIVLLIIGAPLYISLLSSCVVYILCNPDVAMVIGIQKLANGPNSFPLLAVPLFILAGQIMNRGGITTRIFDFAQKLVGRFKGGLGYVNILSSFIFSGMSGSAIADIGGLGLIEIEAMKNAGYEDDFTLGVTAASGTMGPIVPPSIPFVLYGVFANVSIGALFMGGLVPGVLMVITLSAMVYIISKRRRYKVGEKYSLRIIVKSFIKAFPALLSPVIIIGGIWTGFFTPTEAALVSIVYSVLVGLLIYRDLKIKSLPSMLSSSLKMVVPAIVIVVATSLFGWILNYEGINQIIKEAVMGITQNRIIILLFINIILLFLGMFIDAIAAIMLVVPILQPLVIAIGVHPIHFGVIVVLNLMIGLLTPPVGFSLHTLSVVAEKKMDFVTRAISPWLIPLFVALLIVTYIPDIVMLLPKLFGYV